MPMAGSPLREDRSNLLHSMRGEVARRGSLEDAGTMGFGDRSERGSTCHPRRGEGHARRKCSRGSLCRPRTGSRRGRQWPGRQGWLGQRHDRAAPPGARREHAVVAQERATRRGDQRSNPREQLDRLQDPVGRVPSRVLEPVDDASVGQHRKPVEPPETAPPLEPFGERNRITSVM